MTPLDAVLDRVDTSRGPTGCWPWTGPRSTSGYGVVQLDGLRLYAHVVACEARAGRQLRTGEVARHLCEDRSTAKLARELERSCCNPAHLDPGTQAENMADRIRHGRGKGLRPRPNPDRRYW